MRQAARTLALLLAAAMLAAHVYAQHKRAENEALLSQLAPAPFVLGSRYGRSPPRIMAPRNDRFFIGSRYGKRAESPGPRLRPPLGPQEGPMDPLHLPRPNSLLCDYTGVYSLYHCKPATQPSLYRKAEEVQKSEED